MKRFVLVMTVIIWAAGMAPALAETVYVRGVMQITMRTGPGVSNKIIAMLDSGDPLEILEPNDDWTRVRAENGKEGWVLTRFITRDEPLTSVVEKLRKKNEQLTAELETIKTKNAELTQAAEKLRGIEQSYARLKKESADFLELEKKYTEATSTFKEQQERIAALEKSLGSEDIKWFISGAVIFIIGLLLGLSTRKKRRSSLL